MRKDQIAKINPSAIDGEGNVRPFEEQFRDFAGKRLRASDVLVVSASSAMLMPALTRRQATMPLVAAQRTLRKAGSGIPGHDLGGEELAGLARSLEERNVLMMQSRTRSDSIVAVLDSMVRDNVFVAVEIEAETQGSPVNRISSVYERSDVDALVELTWESGLRIYPTENTKDWLHLRGVRFPPALTSLLEDDYTYISTSAQAPSRAMLAERGYGPAQAALLSLAYSEDMPESLIERLSDPGLGRGEALRILAAMRDGSPAEALLAMADRAEVDQTAPEARTPPLPRDPPTPEGAASRAGASAAARNASAPKAPDAARKQR